MYKKIIVLLACMFLLHSCFSSNEQDKEQNSLKKYNTKHFSMELPNNWKTTTSTGALAIHPREGNIELKSFSNKKKDGFVNNIVILSLDAQAGVSNKDYVENIAAKGSDLYAYYKQLSLDDFQFSDGITSKIHRFEANYNASTPTVNYLQTAKVCNKQLFLLTIAVANSIPAEELKKYDILLSSFRCIEPKK